MLLVKISKAAFIHNCLCMYIFVVQLISDICTWFSVVVRVSISCNTCRAHTCTQSPLLLLSIWRAAETGLSDRSSFTRGRRKCEIWLLGKIWVEWNPVRSVEFQEAEKGGDTSVSCAAKFSEMTGWLCGKIMWFNSVKSNVLFVEILYFLLSLLPFLLWLYS